MCVSGCWWFLAALITAGSGNGSAFVSAGLDCGHGRENLIISMAATCRGYPDASCVCTADNINLEKLCYPICFLQNTEKGVFW